MAGRFDIRLDAGDGVARLQRLIADNPRKLKRAQDRVYRKLNTFVTREILRACSKATGIPQNRFATMARVFNSVYTDEAFWSGLKFWVGTQPIPVHRLGTVVWTHRRLGNNSRMKGARVGRTTYPGTWQWPQGKTGAAVMQRSGQFGRNGNSRLEKIERVDIPIHDPVSAALDAAGPEIINRFLTLLQQEINYALNHER
ncbi:hypothetical protein [Thiocapsa sp.]|uniref:hypothetical protein n=1 Tax=Thiocapsa sp. TaxID=2024551 RepID=UPI0025E3609D|nr:hypothetical protein [Thiocapsa sp.]